MVTDGIGDSVAPWEATGDSGREASDGFTDTVWRGSALFEALSVSSSDSVDGRDISDAPLAKGAGALRRSVLDSFSPGATKGGCVTPDAVSGNETDEEPGNGPLPRYC